MKRILLIGAGCASFSIGVAGIFIPILPTTPLLLLSAACFLRSSESLYRWITHHRIFGSYIRCYIQYRAVPPGSKPVTLFLLWACMISTIVFFADALWLKILLFAIASGVSVHILMLRTVTKDMDNKDFTGQSFKSF